MPPQVSQADGTEDGRGNSIMEPGGSSHAGMSIQISNRQESIKEPADGQSQTSDKEAVNSSEDQGNTSDEMTRDRR